MDLIQPELPWSNSTTSREAAESMREKAPFIRERVYQRIKFWAGVGWHGSTCYELERELALSHQTTSARIRELALAERIQDSGERRPTSSGRSAIVWETCDE